MQFSLYISINFGAIRFWNVSRNQKSPKKIYKKTFFGVQGYPKSLDSVAIENQFTNFY